MNKIIYRVLIDETKRLRHINHVLMQRLKRVYRYSNKNVRNVCVGCQILPKNIDTRFPVNSKYLSSQKVIKKNMIFYFFFIIFYYI